MRNCSKAWCTKLVFFYFFFLRIPFSLHKAWKTIPIPVHLVPSHENYKLIYSKNYSNSWTPSFSCSHDVFDEYILQPSSGVICTSLRKDLCSGLFHCSCKAKTVLTFFDKKLFSNLFSEHHFIPLIFCWIVETTMSWTLCWSDIYIQFEIISFYNEII